MTVSPQELVAAGYDAVCERYAAWQSAVADDPRDRYVRALVTLLPDRPAVLEIGCGSGVEPTPTLAKLGRLVAVDISHAQIERARSVVPHAELIHADVTGLTFPEASFDAVVALYVLTHIPAATLPKLVDRVARWLKPAGLLLATFGSGPPHEHVVEDWLGAPMFFSGLEEPTNERLVRGAGLRVLQSRVEWMHEPESEPGRGPVRVPFHWLLARKPPEGLDAS